MSCVSKDPVNGDALRRVSPPSGSCGRPQLEAPKCNSRRLAITSSRTLCNDGVAPVMSP